MMAATMITQPTVRSSPAPLQEKLRRPGVLWIRGPRMGIASIGMAQRAATRGLGFAFLLTAFWVSALILAGGAFAQDSGRASGPSLDSFKLILERNIFDPDRAPARGPRQRAESPGDELPPVDALALIGAVVHDSTVVAVFTGSRDEYRATVRPGDTLAGMTVSAISTNGVALQLDGQRFELPVGSHLSRVGDGPWQVASGPMPEPRRRPGGGSLGGNSRRNAPVTSAPSVSVGGADPEVLKRMLERRQREEAE